MCDTIVCVDSTPKFFAKNSDRDANESQFLHWQRRQKYAEPAMVKCTWISIPQVAETRAVLLSRPFWMWGAEMGANEDGVVIGNEAVFTREPYAGSGLTGMDLVRLALERSRSARQACDIIIELLERWGQGGGCGYENRQFTYHNSFMVVDLHEGFVLETAGRAWAVEAVRGVRAISNGLTIPGFAEAHWDRVKTRISSCVTRRCRSEKLAGRCQTPIDWFHLLRDHGPHHSFPVYSPVNGGMSSLCMHAGGLVAAAQTTASWVSERTDKGWRHWVTATAAPCTSLFKPVYVETPEDIGGVPEDKADNSLWWQHERLHRWVMRSPGECFPLFQEERDALEHGWVEQSPRPGEAFVAHRAFLARWLKEMPVLRDWRPCYVRRYWARRNRRAGL